MSDLLPDQIHRWTHPSLYQQLDRIERLVASPSMSASEAKIWYRAIQNGDGVDRTVFPKSHRGKIAEDLWNDPTFTYGIEYGVLIAIRRIFNTEEE